MKKGYIALIVLVIVILVVITISYKPSKGILFAKSGGESDLPQDKICDCNGEITTSYPKGRTDYFTSYYCNGEISNCKCYNETKAHEFRNLPLDQKRDMIENYEEYIYDSCN